MQMGIWEPLAWKNPQTLASVFMCLSSSSLDFSLSLLLPTDTQRHISELQREACCVSELDLGRGGGDGEEGQSLLFQVRSS